PFVEFAFSDSLPTYRAEQLRDNDNNSYLVWKTQEEAAYVPPLDQVRDKVTEAWKMIKARELARKRAEEYVVQARALQKPLQELCGKRANRKINETGSFGWLPLGTGPAEPGGGPTLGEIDGVEGVGQEFMETVFGLPAGGLGITMNQPQNTLYVIRLIDFEPP